MSEAASQFPQTESFLTGIPTAEESEILLADVNARDARRMAKLAAIAVPDPETMRGRVRESLVEDYAIEPEPIDPRTLIYVSRRLERESEPLTDQFTNHYHFKHPLDYVVYTTKPPKKNKDGGAALSYDPTRDERQKQNVPDRVQTEVRTNLQNAQLYVAALSTVRRQVERGLAIDDNPGKLAAAAIEDFAHKLRANQRVWQRIQGASALDVRVEHIGLYAAEHPTFLTTQPELIGLAQDEHAKAVRFWQRVMGVILEADIDRSTDVDRQRAANIAELIDFLGIYDTSNQPHTS